MLNFCGLVVAILNMATGRNFSMSGHHYLPTYKILMISDNAEFLPPIFYAVFWQPFWKWQTSRKFWKHRIAPLMVTYHFVKFYVSIIIHLEVININVRHFNFPIGFYSNPHPLWTPQNMTLTPFTTKLKTLGPTILSSSSWDLPWTSSWSTERKKERKRRIRIRIRIRIIIIRNGAKTISLQSLFGRLNKVWKLQKCPHKTCFIKAPHNM
jgi:hypothetical protein